MDRDSRLPARAVLDSVSDGVYVTDASRKIVYWNRAAERITGWPPKEIVGKCCFDDILCHVDKDGHQLCGQEFCPLHRAIVTGQSSVIPSIVLARHRDGHRVPMRVSVAPVVDAEGKVIGGVETFRDATEEMRDLERAQIIQSLSMSEELPTDPRLRFSVHYIPHDVIGGDYYAVTRLDSDRYGFFLGDVTGHGVPAALYTMYLRSIWESARHLLGQPAEFTRRINEQFCRLTSRDQPFAAAACGLIDLRLGSLHVVRPGGPYPFLVRGDGRWERLDAPGCALGIMPDFEYQERVTPIGSGDCLFLCTDGAVEIEKPDGQLLGTDGLETVLREMGYPGRDADLAAVEQELLTRSNCIRFDDDLTLLEIRLL